MKDIAVGKTYRDFFRTKNNMRTESIATYKVKAAILIRTYLSHRIDGKSPYLR